MAEILNEAKILNKEGNAVSIQEIKDSNTVIGLYFSAHWCPPCRRYTPMLAEKYQELRKEGKKLEIIFVSSDRDENACKEYYAEHPWLLLDFADRDKKNALSTKYEVSGIPTLILLDNKLDTMVEDGRSAIMEVAFEDLKDYAAKKKEADEKAAKELKELQENFSLSKLLDDQSIVDEDEKEIPLSHFKQAGMITGIYFSAHWCGPCVAFTPKLVEKYNALVKDGKKLDIIFVSFDRDVHNAKEYFADMSWKMLKYEKREQAQKLAEIFEVEGIPSLTLIDEHGKLITNEGTEVLMNEEFDKIKDSQKTVFDATVSASA
jgi:nucleoredoxin